MGLTVKLRGRTEAPQGAEGAPSLSARGAKPQTRYGPLQRLLGGVIVLPRLGCARELTRGEVYQFTIRQAPKRVRMRPNMAGAGEKFTGNHDRSSRC
jgi:hypothetical protein